MKNKALGPVHDTNKTLALSRALSQNIFLYHTHGNALTHM